MDIISLIVIVILSGGIIVVLKKVFNELIAGMTSIDERLKNIEDALKKQSDTILPD